MGSEKFSSPPEKGRRITATEVAQVAGVSIAAVSRAFRADGPISQDKRQRVFAAARDLGYLSPLARHDLARSARSVALVSGELANPFYPYLIDRLSAALNDSGRQLVLYSVRPGGNVDEMIARATMIGAEALVISSATMNSALADSCRQLGLPVIHLNRVQADPRMTAVTSDNYQGGQLVAARFLARMRRRICVISGPRNTSTQIERMSGFRDGLAAGGQRILSVLPGGYAYDGAHAAALTMFRNLRPDAVFCMNDIMALATLDAARSLGLRAPEDFHLIGFDDIPMAAWPGNALTTVRQPVESMIRATLELIASARSGIEMAGTVRVLKVHLIERATG